MKRVLSCIVDRMLGGKGDATPQYKELTDVETSLTKKIIDIIIKNLNRTTFLLLITRWRN